MSRSSLACVYLTCTLMVSAAGTAQNSDAPSLTVMTFRSKDRELGSRTAGMLRDKLANDFSSEELHTVSTTDVSANLEAYGFSVDDSLAPNDEHRLANLLRTDIYLTGRINQAFNGDYHLEPRLVMSIDQTLIQPLPSINRKDLDGLMNPLSHAIKEALKQLEGDRKCIAGVNNRNFAAAVAGARAAIAAYPGARIARLCMAKAFFAEYLQAKSHADSVAYADSVLAVSGAILQEDSLNVSMLQYNAALYKFLSDTMQERQALLSLVHADSNDSQLIERVINSLAGEGRAQDAIPLVNGLMSKSQGDAHVMDLAFKVFAAGQDWQGIITLGPELIKTDTTAGDSTYFIRMATAYNQLDQHQQAIDILSQATVKFPNNAWFWFSYAKELKNDGKHQQAVDVYRQVISMNSQEYTARAYMQLVILYDEMDVPDSVYAIAQRAVQISDLQKEHTATLVLKQGNKLVQAAAAAPDGTTAPSATMRANLQSALKFLQLSNQIHPSVEAQYLIGFSTFQIMQSAAEEAGKTKSCRLAQLAQQSYQDADPVLKGISASDNAKYKQQAQDILGYLPKFQPAIESQIKNFCK